MVLVIMTISACRVLIIFCVIIFTCKLISCGATEEEGETILEDFLICRSCGADAGISNFIFKKLSEKHLVASNDTIFGKKDVLVQIIENPLGIRFEVVALKRANCARIGIWSTSFSWFPGYAWKLCLCPKCASHIGWMFEPVATANKNLIFPSEKGFYLLIVDSVIAEKENLNLIYLGIDHTKTSNYGYNIIKFSYLPTTVLFKATKMVDPNRKINRLTDKDIEFLDECEEEFKDRFTPDDEEFMKHCRKDVPSPPIVEQWLNKKPNYQDGGRGGGGYRDNQRGRKFYNQRGNFRRHPYNNRRVGHSSGYGGRDYQ